MAEPIIKNEDFPILRTKPRNRWELVKESGRVFFQKGSKTLPFNRNNARRVYLANSPGGRIGLAQVGEKIHGAIHGKSPVQLIRRQAGSGISDDEYKRLQERLKGMR